MNVQDLGSIGELVAAVATVLTLGYLAFQLRQNNNLAAGTAQRELMAGFNTNLDRVRDSSELFIRGLRDFNNLSNVEKAEFQLVLNPFINHLELPLRMVKRGLESQDNVDIYGDICLARIQEPGCRACWEKCKPLFFPLSREYIERRLADEGSLPPRIGDSPEWFLEEVGQPGTPIQGDESGT